MLMMITKAHVTIQHTLELNIFQGKFKNSWETKIS